MADTDSSEITQNNNNTLTQQLHQVYFSNSNAKFPYLKKDEYEIWAMKTQNWIASVDFNLWNVILIGNSPKKTRKDSNGHITIYPPSTAEEIIVV